MSIRILNWNTEFVSPRARNGKFERIRALIASYDADVICLTEAYPEAMPDGGHLLGSNKSGRVNAEQRGARKVLLWSRNEWADIDDIGSPGLPEGRFISATTVLGSARWRFVGMCIPYFAYRINKKFWGDDALRQWQGAETYLDALRNKVLPQDRFRQRTILLGDYNLHIPPGKASRQTKAVSRKCEATFAGWLIPTSGIHRRFIDHVAISQDLRVECLRFISRVAADGAELSDHNGVCIDLQSDDPR